jgi:hypothetical protein
MSNDFLNEDFNDNKNFPFPSDYHADPDFLLPFFQNHGLVLASLESLRLQAEKDGEISLSWSMSVIQEMLAACKTSPELIKVLHNIVAKRLLIGPRDSHPSSDAVLAHVVFSGDLTEVEL